MASKYEGCEIEIINWDKHNPRLDSKKPHWFKLDNDMAIGPGFFGLSLETKWMWIVIMSLVSKKNGESIIWNSAYVTGITQISQKKQDEAIEIFEKFVRLRVSRKVRELEPCESVRDTHATGQDRTGQTGQEKTILLAPAHFDLEALYQKFPKKMGKAEGLKKLKKEVKSQDDFDAVLRAIDKFKAHHKQTDPQFIPYFSTFVSTWRDWLDPRTGSAPDKPERDYSFLQAAQ